MQNVGQSDNKKLDCNNKVSVTSTSMNNSSNSSSNNSNNSNNGKIMSTPLNKFSSNNSSPTKSDTETFSEFQPRVTDSSESDEESVSEILLACLYLRPDLLVDSFPLDQGELEEIPDSCSDSCDNEADDNDDDDDDEDDEDDDDDEDDIVPGSPDVGGKFLLEDSPSDVDTDQVQTKARLEALLEAAANISPDKLPVIRRATLALDEAAQTLTKMRTDSSSREKNSVSRSLVAACNDNDVSAVRRLLGEGKSTINEATDDGDSLLSLACSAGYYELAQVLLAMSAQVEDRGQKNDCTPLMEAASAGHVDIIRLLINHGADVNAQSSTGNTPLMYACAGGHVAAVKELLAHDANVEDHNENGHTPLMEAASAGHVEVAKILLEHGAGINTHSNEFKESALTLACYKGHLDMVRFLLEAGADQEHKTDEMHTALMEASMDGHVEVARLLLDSGAQVNMPTDSFESPLTLAACGGHVDLAMLLIERGANIEEVNDEGYTPLMEAAREGHEEMVALLLSQGANINAQTEETQETALTLACCGGFIDVADYLIKNGAKIELGASTPLMEAAQEGHIDLVKYLLESGANVQAQTQTGDTALTYACENGHTDVAEMLLYYNAELEHESEGGRTPLMKACRAGHICTVKFLIGKGADVNRQTTNNDHTPLSLACAGGHQSVVELLLKSGADPFHKLKDNSTMLIEAAKGGHIGVVQMLLDYPQSMGGNANSNNGMVQAPQIQQPFILPQQQQQPPLKQQHIVSQTQQQQLLNVPPGLHEVPEAIRVSNQQLFHQPPLQQVKEGSDPQQQQQIISNSQLVATSTGNIIVDSNSVRQGTQHDSLLTHMRLLQMHHGFSDGLAHGLAHHGFIDGLSHAAAAASSTTPSTSTASSSSSTSNKQKSLMRHKIRQVPSSFESNLTTSEAQQVRSQPVGEDENPIYLTTNSGITEEQLQQHKKILQEYHQKLDYSMPKANIQLICETNGPPATLLPSTAYVDITTPSGQGLVCGTSGISFAPSNAPSLGQMPIGGAMQSAALATFVTGAKPSDNTFLLTASSLPSTPMQQQQPQTTIAATSQRGQVNKTPTTTHISAPSEVSPNTAISDRPKVKPKNLKKSAGVLQQNQMPTTSQSSATDQNLQILQHSMANISLQPQQSNQILLQHQTTSPKQFHTGTQMISPPKINQNLNESSQQAQTIGNIPGSTNNRVTPPNSTINNLQQQIIPPQNNNAQNSINIVPIVNQQPQSTMLLTEQEEQQFSQLISNTQLNQKMLQMVATIPNHPFQKFAQRLCSDQPKSPSESPPLTTTSEPMPSSPSKNISVNNSELADLSRIFCEVMQDIKTELTTAQDFVQVHQHVNHQGKANVNPPFILPQQHTKLNSNQSQQNSINEADDQLHMFTVEDHDVGTISECGIYPPLDEPLDSFTTEDVGNVATAVADGSREPPCNLEWVDYLDEVISALHGVPDLPVALQEIAANLTCHEFETYTNLIGINSFCKTRWTGQWQGNTPQPQLTIGDSASSSSATTLEEQQRQQQQNNPVMTIDHQQLQQQLQQQLSVEQLQLLSHLQNQHNASLSIIPTSAIEQHLQTPNTFTLTSLPPHLTSQCQSTSIASTSAIQTADTQQQQQQQQQQHQQQQQQQQQLQLQQQQQNSLVDAQQQAKLVFNVETDKSSPPLQLLFQLPPVQQGQQQPSQQQPPPPPPQQQAALMTNQVQSHQISPTQTIAQQTQTGLQMQPNIQLAPNLMHPNNMPLHTERFMAQQAQVQAQHCNQHQVQVATQTQQNPNVGGSVVSPAMVQMNQNQQVVPTTSKTVLSSDRPVKKGTEKSRKEKNRYSSLRQAPAGQHQHGNTVAQFPVAGVSNVPQEKTIDVDSETDSNHDTALTLACAGGHEELVELLINRGANIEHRDKKGFTPLILAATAGHEKVVETLLKHGAELEAQSERTKDTPLSLACSGGRYEVVELLLNVGANKEHRNVSDYTPLSLAASGGYVNIIKLLLNSGAEINSRTGSKLGISPLMLAAMNGHTAAVKLLLDMGSDINAQIETNRNTALTLACFQGRHEVVSLLLDRKANVEHRAKTGLTPLMEAASGGYIEVGRVLLDKGADVNAAPVPSSRDTALTIAADKGHIKFVELLLSRGAAVEVKNKKGNSPLWLAANGGHLQVVEVLYNASADIDSQDNRKVSCLMAAFRKGHTKVVKWMVNHVTQFPSDQEMTRYINTVSDKELLEKCNECVKIIRAAKEAQAVKANKNASILLEELDMEKTREESRRAAAARRRERKKKKKIEKKEKRKMIELFKTNNNPKGSNNNNIHIDEKDDDDDDDDDKDDDDDSDKDDESTVIAEPNVSNSIAARIQQHNHNDREEGDSGIDANSHSSCSSADVKTNQIEKARNNKSKKKNNKSVTSKQDRSSISPENNNTNNISESSSIKKKIDLNENKRVSQQPNQKINETNNNNSNKNPKASKDNNNKLNQEKENIIPKESIGSGIQRNYSKYGDKKNDVSTLNNPSSSSNSNKLHSSNNTNDSVVTSSHTTNNANNNLHNRKSLVFETSRYHKEDVYDQQSVASSSNSDSTYVNSNNSQQKTNPKKGHHDNEGVHNKVSPKQVHMQSGINATGKRDGEGWKEVVRKSSIQQSISAPVEQGCKKVQVSAHAISRVIGRAGSNINAIRAATGAHIEVEKQGKAQGDRCITIKGSPDATRQASILIGTLIKDPDVDILTMVPRPNLTKPIVPTGTSIWEKSAPLPSVNTSISAPSSSKATIKPQSTALPTNNATKIITTTAASTISATNTTKSTSSITSTTTNSTMRPLSQNQKNVFTSSQASRSSNSTNQLNSTNNTSGNTSKRNIAVTSNVSHSNTSKSTVSFTNSMHALKNTIKNNSNTMSQIGTFHTSTTPSTFAAKLSSNADVNAKKTGFAGNVPTSTSSSNSVPLSPIKHHTGGNQSGLPAPFTSGINSNTNSQPTSSIGSSNKPPFSQNSPQSDNSSNSNNLGNNNGNTRSITPIGPPTSISRNVTASPLLLQSSSAQSINVNNTNVMTSASVTSAATSIIQPPVTGLASQLQSKINQLQHGNAQAHEYSLFNDSYSNQWEAKQYSSNNSKQFMENVPPLQVDASKAPGYRGTAVSSPVSSKTSSSATTPPSQSHQSSAVVPPIVSSSMPGSTIPNTAAHVSNSMHGDIGKPSNPQSQILQSQGGATNTSGLAVQRPVMNASGNQIRQMDNYGMAANGVHSPNMRQNLYEPVSSNNTAPNLAPQMMNYGQQPEQMQQMFHPNIQTNALHMSRLNPRASAFSSMHQQQGGGMQSKAIGSNIPQSQQHPNQNYSGMFHQNGINNYQKMSSVPYNAAPGPVRNQNQPQGVGNNRWFSELGHLANQREMMGLENGLSKNLGSPAMSPNNSQGVVNGVLPNPQPPMQDDGRKPRPIGTERNWKLGYIGNSMEDPTPQSWMMEKQQPQPQQQIAPNWMPPPHAPIGPPPRNHFVEDMQPPPPIPQDHFQQQWQMEYLNPPHMGPNQSNINLMQSLQYGTFPAPIELGAQLPDKIEQWVEPDKQGWSAKWTF